MGELCPCFHVPSPLDKPTHFQFFSDPPIQSSAKCQSSLETLLVTHPAAYIINFLGICEDSQVDN